MVSKDAYNAPRHGGDLAFARARYGEPPDGWLDLSTGVNPDPYPAPPITVSAAAALPDNVTLADLVAVARAAYNAPAGTQVIAMPGTEIAIRLLPVVGPPGDVAIISPTYSTHLEAWRAAGRNVHTPSDLRAADGAAIVALANPNNPDGRVYDPRDLARLARRLGTRGGLLIVDEAFGDLSPDASLMPHLAGLPAVVLRSFGKFHGLAGLRLGFVAGPPWLVARLTDLVGDWPVSSPAITIGRAALADGLWHQAARRRLAGRSARLRGVLARHDLSVIGGTDLFVLIQNHAAAFVHRGLAQHGVWTRAFTDHPTWLRFGLPANDAAFTRLDRALADVRETVGVVAP